MPQTQFLNMMVPIRVSLPSIDRNMAQAVVDIAHSTNPYSKALRGNVRTDLMGPGPGQAADTRAMPLEDFISQSMSIIQSQPSAAEIIVEEVKSLRFAEERGAAKYESFFKAFNEAVLVPLSAGTPNGSGRQRQS